MAAARNRGGGTKMTNKIGLGRERERLSDESQIWELRLYVAGHTTKSLKAFANLKQICEEYLAGKYRIEVFDVLKSPHLAKGDQILALPTLVRKLPEPVRKIIGDLSNTERVLVGLDLRPAPARASGKSRTSLNAGALLNGVPGNYRRGGSPELRRGR